MTKIFFRNFKQLETAQAELICIVINEIDSMLLKCRKQENTLDIAAPVAAI